MQHAKTCTTPAIKKKKKKAGGWCIPKWMQKADKRGDAVKCTEVVRERERTVSGGREVL